MYTKYTCTIVYLFTVCMWAQRWSRTKSTFSELLVIETVTTLTPSIQLKTKIILLRGFQVI